MVPSLSVLVSVDRRPVKTESHFWATRQGFPQSRGSQVDVTNRTCLSSTGQWLAIRGWPAPMSERILITVTQATLQLQLNSVAMSGHFADIGIQRGKPKRGHC